MSEPISRILTVTGLVQGVFYRASAARKAQQLGLAGWVRNRKDGTVEILVAGERSGVEEFIEWAHEGPRAARVDHVDVLPSDPPENTSFQVLHTG